MSLILLHTKCAATIHTHTHTRQVEEKRRLNAFAIHKRKYCKHFIPRPDIMYRYLFCLLYDKTVHKSIQIKRKEKTMRWKVLCIKIQKSTHKIILEHHSPAIFHINTVFLHPNQKKMNLSNHKKKILANAILNIN